MADSTKKAYDALLKKSDGTGTRKEWGSPIRPDYQRPKASAR